MSVLHGILLGFLQGLTEFLPISSSGHLALAQYFLGLGNVPRFFDVMLHVGTLLAVLVYYRHTLSSLARALRVRPAGNGEFPSRRAAMRWIVLLAAATVPTILAALLFRPSPKDAVPHLSGPGWRHEIGDLREQSGTRPRLVAFFLACTGVILLAGSAFRRGPVDSTSMTWRHALGVGLAQACSALFPGLSRSGTTIAAGMMLGLRPEWAVHFTLILSIPAVLGAAILKSIDLDSTWVTPGNMVATAAGAATSALIGLCCIALLLRSVRGGQWWWYVAYLWALAAMVGISAAPGV